MLKIVIDFVTIHHRNVAAPRVWCSVSNSSDEGGSLAGGVKLEDFNYLPILYHFFLFLGIPAFATYHIFNLCFYFVSTKISKGTWRVSLPWGGLLSGRICWIYIIYTITDLQWDVWTTIFGSLARLKGVCHLFSEYILMANRTADQKCE